MFIHIHRLIYFIQTILIWLFCKLSRNIDIMGVPKVKAWPSICVRNGGHIKIGKNVTINSSNYLYHAGMYSIVKLFVDVRGAIIDIGDNTRMHGCCIHAKESVTIGRNCLIAANCQIIDSNGHDVEIDDELDGRLHTSGIKKRIEIGDNVWIGLNSIILPGVKIGKGSIIGAGSVVTSDIPDYTVAAGNPAKIIKTIR